MDKIAGMSAFVRVAETKSFKVAGEQLGLTASAVSKAITRLEERIGVQLINRNSRSLSLTSEGEEFLTRSQQILAEIEGVEEAMATLSGVPRGALRVNLPIAFGRMHVVDALPRFLADHPELSVNLSLTDRFVDFVDEGVDIAVRMSRNGLDDSRLVARTLMESRLVICGSPAYLADREAPSTPDDLDKHNCLRFSHRGRPYPWRLLADGAVIDRVVEGSLQSDNGEVLRDAALAGVGLAQLHSYIAAPEIAAGRLCVLLTSNIPPAIPIFVLFPKTRKMAPKVRVFIDFIIDRFSKPGVWTLDDPDEMSAKR